MKKILLVCLLIFSVAHTSHAAATKLFGRDALTGGVKSVDNIPYASLSDGDLCIVVTSSKMFYIYRFESSSADVESSPMIITPDDQAGNGRWELATTDRYRNKLDITDDTDLTEAQIIAYRYISNQGDVGEADIKLPAISYAIGVIFIIEEAVNIEINPPAGEAFDLDGVALDGNDCVDSDSTVGSKIAATRMQNAAGIWIWSLDTIRGSWTDTGASD